MEKKTIKTTSLDPNSFTFNIIGMLMAILTFICVMMNETTLFLFPLIIWIICSLISLYLFCRGHVIEYDEKEIIIKSKIRKTQKFSYNDVTMKYEILHRQDRYKHGSTKYVYLRICNKKTGRTISFFEVAIPRFDSRYKGLSNEQILNKIATTYDHPHKDLYINYLKSQKEDK